MTLRKLRVSGSLPLESEEWPDDARLEILRQVHLQLDADDMLTQLFQEATSNDSSDATMVGT